MSKSTRRLGRAGIAAAATTALVASGFAFAGANASEPVELDRIKGDNRYGTSVEAAKAFGTAEDVILASGENGHYVDALSANFLAGVVEAPILLTKENKLPAVVKQQIEDGNYATVHIIGGDGAVSDAVEAEVRDTGAAVNRIFGANRYRTNADVIAAGAEENSDTALIATGVNFPDALGAGPVAYSGKHPIGLTKTDDIPDFVVDALKDSGVDKAIIVGGEAAVSDAVRAELEAKQIDVVDRLSGGQGGNRETTSIAVREFAIENLGFSESEVDFASGREASEGVDALSGGPVSGKDDVAILITASENRANRLVAYLEENCEQADEGDIYGGSAAVSDALETELEEAMQCDAGASATERPELTGATIVSTTTPAQQTPTNLAGTVVRYTFDEAVLETGAPPRIENFQVYTSAGVPDDADALIDVDGNQVTVRFNAIDSAEEAAALTLATVDRNAVTDADGDVNPEGDAPLGATTGGGATALPAGITTAPDLVSVGNFRQGQQVGQTAVDFTFDEAAFVTGEGTFSLVLIDGANGASGDNQLDCAAPAPGTPATGAGSTPSGGTIVGGNGTTTITVICEAAGDEILTAADVARGTVDADTVSDVQQDADTTTAATGNTNVLQAADVSNGGNTAEPDLVSVALRASTNGSNGGVDSALFTFDQPVTEATAADFTLYTNEVDERSGSNARINSSDGRQVLVDFVDGVSGVVGGNVVDGAVVAGISPTNLTPDANEQDEAGVAGTTAPATGQTAGRTTGPDLTGVAISRAASDDFGNLGQFQATYTFDEPVTTTLTLGDFNLYLADGSRLQATACSRGTDTTGDDRNDNTVTCTAYDQMDVTGTPDATSAQIGSAVLGTVDDGAVTDGTDTNPEGAEFTSGGTGSPSA